ncbi:MAG: cobyrinate a,c-diamide synthase [Mariprofundales bacterium]
MITLSLMQHLRARGWVVAPFKAGPDFLDPMWHNIACARTSYNLDTRMMGVPHCRTLFAEQSANADIALIEGVMGMFDGAQGVGEAGSSAHLASVLDTSVLLVVNAKGMSGSLVALVEGFVARASTMGASIAGVIANQVGSKRHAQILKGLLTDYQLPPLVAWMEKGAPMLAERHLGLVMPEAVSLPDFSRSFHVEAGFFTAKSQQRSAPEKREAKGLLKNITIAVAFDTACCFVYAANLAWLRDEGAQTCFFSPLAGEPIPAAADGLWLPGGYPELHAQKLSQSASLTAIQQWVADGNPTLAECGGMMLLGRSISTNEGDQYAMAGLLPYDFVMQSRLAGLGYRQDASGVCGHEFHHSKRVGSTTMPTAFSLQKGDAGLRYKNLRASYIHWYFSSQPKEVASWFLNRDHTPMANG